MKMRVGLAALVLVLAAAAPAVAQEEKPQPEVPPAPSKPSEGFKWGLMEGHSEIEVGYRWVSQAGNRDMYRSMINLGEGPKLLRSSFSLRSPYGSVGLFDHVDLELNSWGGEPYNTMRLRVGRSDLYELQADYRNLNYYNFLSSYSNPLLGRGSLLGQHSLNVTQRTTSLELRLFPGRRFRPFVGYQRSSGFGPGFTTTSVTGNEFLLDTDWRYSADEYRGGVQIELPRLSLTVEQGYRVLRNDTGASRTETSTGNGTRPYLGQSVVLDHLGRSYRDRTRMPVSRVVMKLTPAERLKITGRYVYSMAEVDSTFSQIDSGDLVSLEDLLFYKTGTNLFDTAAKRPSHTGGFVVEYSPFSRLTIIEQLDARSYHVSGSALLQSGFYSFRPITGLQDGRGSVSVERAREASLAHDLVRNQAELELEVARGLALRAGHRYTRVDAVLEDRAGDESSIETGELEQQTALAGFAFRRGGWLRLALDYENNQTDRALTRTDLYDYDQLRFDWRVRPTATTSFSGRVAFLRNSNGRSDLDYSSHNRNYTFAFSYDPGERCAFDLDYTRANLYSSLAILLPQTLDVDRSLFDERSHGLGGRLSVEVYRRVRVGLGYRGLLNAGSSPLNYHQPFAQLDIPVSKSLVWKTYWQYFGYNEKGASIQDHRSHLVTFALAFAY